VAGCLHAVILSLLLLLLLLKVMAADTKETQLFEM
jgi:hypothetical protein